PVPICIRLRVRVPTVDLGQHGFHFWIAMLVFGVPPVERAQWFIDWIVGFLCFADQAQSKLMHEPSFRSCVTRRVNRFLAPLQKTLCVSKGAFFFSVTPRWKKEHFRLDFFRLQFAPINLGRLAPKSSGLD